jgi:hypothetical protein
MKSPDYIGAEVLGPKDMKNLIVGSGEAGSTQL